MCIAHLNVSTTGCAHRWYELARACHPANNLANCPEKLKLEGWETRTDTCPWCEANEVTLSDTTHRLFGAANISSASSSTSSPTSPDLGLGRSSSWKSTASATSAISDGGLMSPLSRHSSNTSVESNWGQKHRDMNERLEIYLSHDPHEVLPSAAKNYPTYASAIARQSDSSSMTAPVRRTRGSISKRWRSVRNSVAGTSMRL